MRVLIIFLSIPLIIQADNCIYTTPDGNIDLKTLGYKDRPKYIDIHDSRLMTLTYSFNGCFSYSTSHNCQNAAACVTDDTLQTTEVIARQENRTFSYNQGQSIIIYTDGSDITVHVFLNCKTTESIQASRNDGHSYIFNIESKCGCPGECIDRPDQSPSRLEIGTIFLIILFTLIASYLIISVLILRFVKHERGVNLIPNRTLWIQIGSDSFGGIRFLFSKLPGRNRYNHI